MCELFFIILHLGLVHNSFVCVFLNLILDGVFVIFETVTGKV